jgi:hypothetical protein
MLFMPTVSRKALYFSLVLMLSFVICIIPVASAEASIQTNDLDSSGPPPSITRMLISAAAVQSTIKNADGSFTFTQTVNGSSTAPNYTVPASGGGFGIYSYYNQDFGWMHDFPAWNTPGLSIQSATLMIRAYDIDSEVSHGQDGEYDGVKVDGTQLNPGYLQGTNNTWSNTTFNIPVTNITDDGKMNVWLDIDMHHNTPTWATSLDSSVLTITYQIDNNKAPYQPVLSQLPTGTVNDNNDLVINVVGPQPADPDSGDSVHYTYRWFVDVGTGSFVDDEFAGRNDHSGNTVPAADTRIGDKWRVQVTPVDNHNAIGPFSTATWAQITPVDYPPVVTATPDRAPNAHGWYNSDVTVQFNATDTDQTPVKQIDAPVLVTTEGANQVITGKAVDTAGLQGTASVSISLDKTAPVTTAAPINTGWVNHEVTVQLSATDLLSGVDKTYFSLDGGATQAGTSVVIIDEGSHTLTYWSEDIAGNTELKHSTAIQIDKTAPTTKAVAPADWIHQDITMQLNATDNKGGSGIAGIYYSLDGGPQQTGSEVQVSGEGTHTLVYWSVDNAGNTEMQNTAMIKIDKTAPVTTADAPSGWVNHDVTVALSAVDQINGSGVAITNYTLDGGTEQTGISVNITMEGLHTLTYWSVDHAGNVESKHQATIQIDKTAPVTVASANGKPNLNGWYSSNQTVTLSVGDNLSGVAKTLYRINSGAWTDYAQPFTVVTEGKNHIEYKSVDNAGNGETEKTLDIQLDKTAPTFNVVLDKTSLFPPNHQLVTVQASVYSSDATSDIDSVVLTSITSNEPDNGLGDGDTENDIQDAQYGTLDTSFNLRSERSGKGSGRVYTIVYTATDKAGNQTIVKVTVTVPHNNNKK